LIGLVWWSVLSGIFAAIVLVTARALRHRDIVVVITMPTVGVGTGCEAKCGDQGELGDKHGV
jgi:hypothetical protein